MKKLYFVRHGLSLMNIHGLFAGTTETALTDRGRVQAVAAGQQARSLQLDLIVTSPASRAHETAVIIANEIGYPVDKIITSDLLLERDFGIMEGEQYEPGLDIDENVPGAETIEDLLKRGHAAADWLRAQTADNILVVSHGSIGRALRHIVDPAVDFRQKLENGKIVELI